MRAFAQKPKATEQITPAKSPMPSRAHFGQSRGANLILPLQRMTGSQAAQHLPQADTEELASSSSTTDSTHLGHDFSRIPLRAQPPDKIQSPVMMNTPGTISEQEADNVAVQVLRMPEPQLKQVCACGGGCPKCQNVGQGSRQTLLQTKPAQANDSTETVAPPIVHEMLNRTGQPLDMSTRVFMEPRFGADFSRVRLHTDSLAAKAAKAVNARAFTVGNDIVFGEAQYMPHAQATQRLLAHELAHVVQQSQLGRASVQRMFDGGEASGDPGGGAGAPGASIHQEYVRLICEAIAGIREAVEEGRVWPFEPLDILQDEEHPNLGHARVQGRWEGLQTLIADLGGVVERIESGALVPSEPVSMDGLASLWREHARLSRMNWLGGQEVSRVERLPTVSSRRDRVRRQRGVITLAPITIEAEAPQLSWYFLHKPDSQPGVLERADFPTWYVLGCQDTQQPEHHTAQSERVTPGDLGLSRQTIIYVTRGIDGNLHWDWEPRRSSIPITRRYEWHYDQSAGRVFIVVDGQRLNLLRGGRTEIQR